MIVSRGVDAIECRIRELTPTLHACRALRTALAHIVLAAGVVTKQTAAALQLLAAVVVVVSL
jgi:hypothetical protein